jgi:hypothetical protein
VDVGRRRRAKSAAESVQPPVPADDLIRYLEDLTARKFMSCEDVLRLLEDIREENVEATRTATRRRIVREALLLGALTASYLHFNYWDVELQIASLPAVRVFVPASHTVPHQRTHDLDRTA